MGFKVEKNEVEVQYSIKSRGAMEYGKLYEDKQGRLYWKPDEYKSKVLIVFDKSFYSMPVAISETDEMWSQQIRFPFRLSDAVITIGNKV